MLDLALNVIRKNWKHKCPSMEEGINKEGMRCQTVVKRNKLDLDTPT